MAVVLEVIIVCLSVILICAVRLYDKNPPPIFNVYRRPSGLFWPKVIFMYTILTIRKFFTKLRIRSDEDDKKLFAALDVPQKLSFHEKAIDAVYFNGASEAGQHLVVGTARRKNRLVDGFFYLLVPSSGLDLLESPKLPGTSLQQTEDTDQYAAEGIKVAMVEPMKKWKIIYEGKMKQHSNRSNTVDVVVEAEWKSDLPYFNFDTDMDPWAMAKGMAVERWSREYFKNLKTNHQTHYEQFGDLKGTATIDGKVYKLDLNTVRDHSFGTLREWRHFHRYALHYVSTANGDRINVGIVSTPLMFSSLPIGFVYSAEDKAVHPVTSLDLQLYQHGEKGRPPLDYAFSFEAGGRRYCIQVNVVHSPHFYISQDWESKVIERLCTFKVNGVKGWGAAEWDYRNIKGKSAELGGHIS